MAFAGGAGTLSIIAAKPVSNPSKPLDFGDFRRLAPVDDAFGLGRGKPIDRHYIEGFLQRCSGDVRGRVLEVGDSAYTSRFGAAQVVQRDVLHMDRLHPGVTLVADLTDGNGLPSDCFDCFICTQTLQYVHALKPAIATICRILKPGGVLLLTVPGISQISLYDRSRWGEHWRFMPQSLERLLNDEAGFVQVAVEGHGNVLAATGFLQGLACEDLTQAELDHQDDRYPMLVAARAVKTGAAAPSAV